jgi:hypothetical protein
MSRMAKVRGDRKPARGADTAAALATDVGAAHGMSRVGRGGEGAVPGRFELAFADALQDILRDERRARLWLSMPPSCPR